MPEDDRTDTTKLAPPDQVQIALAKLQQGISTGFAEVGSRLDSQDTVLAKVSNEGVESNTRLSRLESRVQELEDRITRNSSRVRDVSSSELGHDASIGLLAAKVDELAGVNSAQLAILARLDKITSNPIVKTIVAMVVTSAITWLATKGIMVPK